MYSMQKRNNKRENSKEVIDFRAPNQLTDHEIDERIKKIVILVYGTLDSLIDSKMVTGPKMLTKLGKKDYQKLLDEKFDKTISPEEFQKWCAIVINDHDKSKPKKHK